MSITLCLMGSKGFAFLQHVINNGHIQTIDKVYSFEESGLEESYLEKINNLCEKWRVDIECNNRPVINTPYTLAVAWRWMINSSTTQIITFHDSLLPKYRGFAPLVNMLLNEEKHLGVTAFMANEGFDEGDIIVQRSVKVNYPIKIKQAIESVIPLYLECCDVVMEQIRTNAIVAYAQNSDEATYSIWLDDDDYCIDWNHSADYILRFINSKGFPYKGAYSRLSSRKVIIIDAEIVKDKSFEHRHVGKVFKIDDGCPVVICGEGLIKLTNMVYSDSQTTLLPFTKLRSRFK